VRVIHTVSTIGAPTAGTGRTALTASPANGRIRPDTGSATGPASAAIPSVKAGTAIAIGRRVITRCAGTTLASGSAIGGEADRAISARGAATAAQTATAGGTTVAALTAGAAGAPIGRADW